MRSTSNTATDIHRPLSSLTILSVRVHRVSIHEVLDMVEAAVDQRRRERIIPVNPEMIMAAQGNIAFRHAINGSSLALADGIGVVIASRLLRTPISTRLTGVDTLEQIAALAESRHFRIFLLGAGEGVADRAAAHLLTRYPGLQIAGTFAGSPRPEDEELIRRTITSARPDILFIAYGAPKQELWIERNHPHLDVPIAMCVGGAFDFLSEEKSRAPGVIRELGLEWLYRLIQEPWRWKRMLALPRFTFAILLHSVLAGDSR